MTPQPRLTDRLTGVRRRTLALLVALVAALPVALGAGVPSDPGLLPAGDSLGGQGGVLASHGLGNTAGRYDAGSGVTVAVIDTGVSDTPALNRASGRLVDGVDTSRLDEEGVIRYGGPFLDGYGHGTFLAGLVAGGPVPATGDRALGVAPGARVVVVKVAEDSGKTSPTEVIAGLNWVAAHADSVDVASLALTLSRPHSAHRPNPLTAAVARVQRAGVPIAVAAGNVPGEISTPGFTARALTVGAADVRDGPPTVADFSGGGVVAGRVKPDVVANGVDVLGLLPPGSVLAREHPDAQRPSGLWAASGTSQATAVTAGVAALLLAGRDEPGTIGPRQVTASLRAAARPLPDGDGVSGAGLVQAPTTVTDPHRPPAVARPGPNSSEGGVVAGGANSWGANSWGANSWGANSWGANSWGANSWGANSWGANSWGANSWGANSWGANSWGLVDDGEGRS